MHTLNRRSFIHSILKASAILPVVHVWPSTFYENSPMNNSPIPLIVDADTANEVDDLFAIARAVISPNLDIKGITSAQWHTQDRAPNDTVGESQRLNEDILRLMNKTNIPHPAGSNIPMVNKLRPQKSAATNFIIEQALKMPEGIKLQIAILGPATNIASAVLIEPSIIHKISVNYLGFWYHPETNTWNKREFNTNNDPNAIDVLLNTQGLELHIMTASTSQHLVFEKSEVDKYLKGKGGIEDYLVDRWESYDRFWSPVDKEKTKWIMWDVAIIEAIAYPELATQKKVVTPHDNLKREIYVYTSIDVEKMKANYWASFIN